jgi:hypothetical protein
MTIQRAQALSLLALALAATLAVAPGCGDDGADGAGGSTPTCGTTANPEVLTVTERSPEAESLVANDAVVHRFRIVNAPGMIQEMQFELPASHTAGAPIPARLAFTVTQEGSDLVYEGAPLTWTTAPGRVEMRIAGTFQTDDGCVYAFPSPLFAYDLDESGGGGGGVGGSGVGGGGEGGQGGGGEGGQGGG